MSCESRVTLIVSRALGKVVVTLVGELGAGTAKCLRPLIADLVEGQGNLDVEIDLRDASVDSVGVGLLVETSEQSRGRGGILVVSGAPPALRGALESQGLTVAGD